MFAANMQDIRRRQQRKLQQSNARSGDDSDFVWKQGHQSLFTPSPTSCVSLRQDRGKLESQSRMFPEF